MPLKVTIVPKSRIVHIRDEEHASQLLKQARPELDETERTDLARGLLAGDTLLVREDEWELLDPYRAPDFDPIDPDPDPAPVPDEETTYIGLCVIDAEGRPVPALKYRLTLPTGAEVTGQLDQLGATSHDGIKSGACYVVFDEPILGGAAPSPGSGAREPVVLDTFEEADDDDLDDGEADSPPTDPRTAGDAARPDEHEEVDDDAIPFAEP